jgi:hypothetical protein
VALAGLASVVTAPGAVAHEVDPTVLTVLDERRPFEVPLRQGGRAVVVRGHLEPRTTVQRFTAALVAVPEPAAGLVVQLLEGRAPGLFLRYDGAGEAVVDGAGGEPFLCLGPAGAEVNQQRSPTWLFTAQARGEDLTGSSADPAAAPAWASVSASPSYAWLDPRALLEEPRPGAGRAVRSWTVAITVDGERFEARGRSEVTEVPLAELAGEAGAGDREGSGGRVLLVVAAAIATLVVVALLARRRRPPPGAVRDRA